MVRRIRPLPAFMMLLGLSFAQVPAQETHRIGAQKARIELSSSWKRSTLDPDMGEDQFICSERGGFLSASKQAYLTVLELEMLLENPEDFELALSDLVTVEGAVEWPVSIQPGRDYTRATRRVDAKVNGMSATFRLELLSRSGLSYLLMAWSSRSKREFLDEKVEELVDGFRFPGRGSEFARQSRPVERAFAIDGYDLSFSVRPFVLRETDEGDDWIATFASVDQQHGIFVSEPAGYRSADKVLDAALEAHCAEPGEFVEVTRSDRTISGVDGRMLVAKSAALTAHFLALPAGRGRFLDLRYVSSGAPDERREDRDLFLDSLKLVSTPTVIELPEPVASTEPPALDGNREAVFDRAVTVGDTGLANVSSVRQVAERTWVAAGWQRVVLLRPGQPAETLASVEGWGVSVVPWGDHWLMVSRDGVVRELRRGVARQPESFTARCLATVGDELLLARAEASRVVVGINDGSRMGGSLIVHRTDAGAEHVVARLSDVEVTTLVTNTAGTVALALANRLPALGTRPYSPGGGPRCVEVELDSGAVRDIGEWAQVEHIAAADGGWLITGRPEGRSRGVYLARGAKLEPLLTGGRMIGVGLAEGRLTFASDLVSAPPQQPFHLYEVPVADIAEVGPRCQPFASRQLNEIGRRILRVEDPDAAPTSEAALRQVVADANRIARELVDADLPVSGAGVDALFDEVLSTAGELGAHGRILLAVLVAVANLEQGAVWVESGSCTWLDWIGRPADVDDTAFAVARNPVGVLVACLDDSEGMWDPGTSIREEAKGRQLFFGLQPEALRARVAAAEPEGLAAALAGDRPEPIQALLESIPANVVIRRQVYQHLARAGRFAWVEQIGRAFAGRSHSDPADSHAWLAAWLERLDGLEEADALVRAALDQVRAHPDCAELSFVLGHAYEKARPDDSTYARACYHRVLRIQEWGTVADAARQALERIGS